MSHIIRADYIRKINERKKGNVKERFHETVEMVWVTIKN